MAMRCSYVIWINRYNKSMDFRRLMNCDIPDDMWYISRRNILHADTGHFVKSSHSMGPVRHVDGLQLLDTIRKLAKKKKVSVEIPPPYMRDSCYDPSSILMQLKYGSQLSAANLLLTMAEKTTHGCSWTRERRQSSTRNLHKPSAPVEIRK